MIGKDGNPKSAVGVKKPGSFSCLPTAVLFEASVGMMEGARRYGRNNWRVAGARASTYWDATLRHLFKYWEGEDIDPDSGVHHLTKAITSLMVLRDAQIRGNAIDDRPPGTDIPKLMTELQVAVDSIFERIPEAAPAFTRDTQEAGGRDESG